MYLKVIKIIVYLIKDVRKLLIICKYDAFECRSNIFLGFNC